jgi:hypothetical protein
VPRGVGQQDVGRVFGVTRPLVDESGLATGFAYQPHLPDAHEQYSPIFAASALLSSASPSSTTSLRSPLPPPWASSSGAG